MYTAKEDVFLSLKRLWKSSLVSLPKTRRSRPFSLTRFEGEFAGWLPAADKERLLFVFRSEKQHFSNC